MGYLLAGRLGVLQLHNSLLFQPQDVAVDGFELAAQDVEFLAQARRQRAFIAGAHVVQLGCKVSAIAGIDAVAPQQRLNARSQAATVPTKRVQ